MLNLIPQNRLSPVASILVGLGVFLGLQPFLYWLWGVVTIGIILGDDLARVSPTEEFLAVAWAWVLELAAIAATLTVIWRLARTKKVIAVIAIGLLLTLLVIVGLWHFRF